MICINSEFSFYQLHPLCRSNSRIPWSCCNHHIHTHEGNLRAYRRPNEFRDTVADMLDWNLDMILPRMQLATPDLGGEQGDLGAWVFWNGTWLRHPRFEATRLFDKDKSLWRVYGTMMDSGAGLKEGNRLRGDWNRLTGTASRVGRRLPGC